MSLEAKLIFTCCVLAIILPIMGMVVRRMIRGEPFDKSGGMILPPSGPPVDIDGGGP